MMDLPKRDLRALLSEYMYLHRWTTHSEAIAAGFGAGDKVYGQVLKSGGKFKPENTAAWRRAYETSERKQVQSALGTKVDPAALDPAVVDWTLRVCLSGGAWSKVKVLNDCRFAFSAGIASGSAAPSTARPLRFEVHGARCGNWPRRALSVKGEEVQCIRSGDGPVTVELATDRAGLTRQTLPPVKRPELAPEPIQERSVSGPASEVVMLSRSRDYHLQRLGSGCPNCSLYAADLHPSEPDAVILRATTVSSVGAGWQPCPAGLRCGVHEFSPPDEPMLSGCNGLSVCRVWRLAESGGEASDVIQIDYQKKTKAGCKNCPDNMDFETAHREWEQTRDKALARCETFADLPAQMIAPDQIQ